MLKAEVKVFNVKLQIREDELWRSKEQGAKGSVPASRTNEKETEGTSSRIFFHMMRVISSPSSSTTGFFTTIFSPNKRITHRSDHTAISGHQRRWVLVTVSPGHEELGGSDTHYTKACC